MEIDPVIANPNVARNASSPSHHEQISLEESHAGVRAMIHACAEGNRSVVERFLTQRGPTTPSTNDDSNGDNEATFYYAAKQDVTTGQSPLMAAAHGGHLEICQLLLDHGAPWNAIDRNGQCAGNYAVTARQWPIVNLLVEWGTKAELILSAATRWQRKQLQQEVQTEHLITTQTSRSVEQEPCTKPDYLRQKLHYQGKNDSALVDQDGDAVMMEWERPLMELHAAQLMEAGRRTVLNVGFGLGLIDTALQTYQPALHVIIEAHPQVYQRMLDEQWDQKPGVRIEFGTWQEVLPRLIQQGLQVDAVFFDTYGEHFLDLEDFHNLLPHILSKPHGMYSFFNGLAPDNIFFHGVGTLPL
jgi:protein arginine N-methyltransferase 2